MIPINWIWISFQSIIAYGYILKQKPKTKRKRRRKRLEEAAEHQKSKDKSRRALLQFFSKYLVLQKDLAQQANT